MSLAEKCVVVCEDESIEVMHLRHVLRMAGVFVVGCAHTGEDAVQTVLEAKPDLVIMDINMPKMNGLDAAERILAQYPVCMVVLTAYDYREYRERAKQLGVCAYLVKPVNGEILLRTLEAAVAHFSATQAPALKPSLTPV